MGVPHNCLGDPWLKRLHEYSDARLLQYAILQLPDFGFHM
jgi:hypothetical protein